MQTTHQKQLFYYLASLSIHLIVFISAVIFLDWSKEVPLIGDTTQPSIASYVYHQASAHESIKPIAKKTVTEKAVRISKPIQKIQTQRAAYVNLHQTGKQTKSLLALLHAAIQQNQQYPSSAIEMERQGKATVKFILFPNGKIENLQLEKSSGVESLDRAALAAVQNAAPFHAINVYLQSSQEFSIDVVFELA